MPMKIAHSKAETKTFFQHPEPMCSRFSCSVLCAGKRKWTFKGEWFGKLNYFTCVNIHIYFLYIIINDLYILNM